MYDVLRVNLITIDNNLLSMVNKQGPRMVSIKSTRGVQQEDVWGAADLLIAEGLRPTIERVRQKIGRGSPNTVSPMLEGWFATLGPRLGVSHERKRAAGEGWPEPVQQAIMQLWDSAQSSAREAAQRDLQSAQSTLDAERATLAAQQQVLLKKEHDLSAKLLAADELLAVMRGQVGDLTGRLKQADSKLAKQDDDLRALRLRLADLENLRLTDQQRHEAQEANHAAERQRLEDRSNQAERRLMTELDRDRQELKRLKALLKEAEVSKERADQQQQSEKSLLVQRLRDAELLLTSERQSLAAALERGNELRALLDAQQASHAAAMAQHLQQPPVAPLNVTTTRFSLPARSNPNMPTRRKLKKPNRQVENANNAR